MALLRPATYCNREHFQEAVEFEQSLEGVTTMLKTIRLKIGQGKVKQELCLFVSEKWKQFHHQRGSSRLCCFFFMFTEIIGAKRLLIRRNTTSCDFVK